MGKALKGVIFPFELHDLDQVLLCHVVDPAALERGSTKVPIPIFVKSPGRCPAISRKSNEVTPRGKQ